MDESTLEKVVGDLTERKRTIAKLLNEDKNDIPYGPLTLKIVNADTEILPIDFDGRVYKSIQVPRTDDTEEQVDHIVTEADKRIKQLNEEL